MILKKILTDKIFISVVILYIFLGIGLFNLIPHQLNKIAIDQSIEKGKTILDALSGAKHFYSETIVTTILEKDKNKDLFFSYNFKEDGGLPFPGETVLSLRDYVKDNELKINIYSDYPFKHRSGRRLDKVQLKALRHITNTKKGTVSYIETINNTQMVRVVKANYMSSGSCIKCHNTHPDKDWDFDWEIGDIRGVMEIIMPVSHTLQPTIIHSKLIMIGLVITLMILSLLLYGYNIYINDRELKEINSKLTDEVSSSFQELSMENKILEHNLSEMYSDFSKYVIYSKTDLFGIITEASDALCEISGYTQNELIGSDHSIIRHEDTQDSVFKEMWDSLNLNKVWNGETKNKKKDGTHYWVKTFITPIYDTDHCKIGYIAIRNDITKKKDKEILELANKIKYGYRRKSKRDDV